MSDITSNAIANLMHRHNLSYTEASKFATELVKLRNNGFDDRTIDLLIPAAIQVKKTKTYYNPQTKSSEPITWGMAVHFAERNTAINTLIGKKRNLPGDRRDTQFIQHKMPGGIRVTDVKTKQIISGESKYTPTYKHLKSQFGNEIVSYREPDTKYYYYDDDENYINGSDTPPPYTNIAYIQSKLVHKIAASKYSKPTVTDNGVEWNKESGIKEYALYYMVGKDLIKSILVEMPYERDVEFNMMKSRQFAAHIKKELDKFRNEYGAIPKRKYTTDDENKKILSDMVRKEYYGDEERKRKRNKIKATRKKIKKVTKKKCVCNPKQKRILRKIVPKKRRK